MKKVFFVKKSKTSDEMTGEEWENNRLRLLDFARKIAKQHEFPPLSGNILYDWLEENRGFGALRVGGAKFQKAWKQIEKQELEDFFNIENDRIAAERLGV